MEKRISQPPKKERRKPETNEITIYPEKGKPITYSKDMVEAIKNTVAKTATDSELVQFLTVAYDWGLNPWKKEIWFIKVPSKKGYVTRIECGRDGYMSICKRDPEFLTVQSAVVHENDLFDMEFDMGECVNIKHRYKHTDRGEIVGAWAVAKHTNPKRNVWDYLPYNEMDEGTPVWQSKPSLMSKKVVEAVVLKRMGGISGMVTDAEMGTDKERVTRPKRNPNATEPEQPSQEQIFQEEADIANNVIDAEFQVKKRTKPDKAMILKDDPTKTEPEKAEQKE